MTYHTFMLLQGEKVRLEVDPNAINTVAVSLEDGSIIFAVAGASAVSYTHLTLPTILLV